MFSLYDVVVSKRTGLPAKGTIVIIADSEEYIRYNGDRAKYGEWDRLYPNWRDKPVYTVKLDQPQRYTTFEEFKRSYERYRQENGYETIISNNDLYKMYEKDVKEMSIIMYVEDDLELFDE